MKTTAEDDSYKLDLLQRIAMGLMTVLTLLTFFGANMQALLWQSSDWLVSTVLPAVVVDLTNDQRVDLAAAPLQRNSVLDAAAREKAQHMADNEYFAHFAPDGTTPWSFFRGSGYVFAHAGENLAIHFTDSTQVVDAWMDSPAHRKNIIDTKFTEIGVGTAKGKFDGYDTVYVVQLFGTPAMASTPTPSQPVVVTPTPATTQPVSQSNNTAELVALQEEIEAAAAAIAELESNIQPDPIVLADEAETQLAVNTVPTKPVQALTAPVEPPTTLTVSDTDTVIVSSELATSSGLAVATLTESSQSHAGATLAAVATQPNVFLNIAYTGIVGVIIVLLVLAMLGEMRRFHMVQVAYSFALLLAIGGLWYMHSLLTSGAVIV